MALGLSNLVDSKRIVAIDATPIPAPPRSPYPGEHLFVNCYYELGMTDRSPAELLEIARADAVEIVRRLAMVPHIHNYVSAVVTIYGYFASRGTARPARRRVYRISVPYAKFTPTAPPPSPEFLEDILASESSELENVEAMIHQTAS